MSLTLAAGAWSATLLPEQGGAFARLEHEGRPVLAPLPEGADPNTGRAGAFWMIPWANRLDGGRLGEAVRVPVNLPAEGNAIHGLSRDRPWRVREADAAGAILEQRVEAAGFDYRAHARIRLGVDGLALGITVKNGGGPRPFGLGWHPWFARRAGQRIRFGAKARLACDDRGLPVTALVTAGVDTDAAGLLGADAHFTGWDGTATIEESGACLVMRAVGAWAGNLQLFLPPSTPAICLEPSSHFPDAPNRPALGASGGMTWLATGERLSAALTLGVEARPAMPATGR